MQPTIWTSLPSCATSKEEGFQPRLEDSRRGSLDLIEDPGAAEVGLAVWFTGRDGGVSRGPFSSLNLGAHVGDDEAAVAENLRRACHAAGFDPARVARVRQVHGAAVVASPSIGEPPEADAIVIPRRGGAAMVVTADCVPIVVAGGDSLAVIHAGWRGLVAGVVEGAVKRVPDPFAAWIGPSIRSCCYRVGPEVTEAFRRAGLPLAGPDRVDPAEAAEAALNAAGVGAVAMSGVCTSCSPGHYSHRRDGITGRQGGFAGWR